MPQYSDKIWKLIITVLGNEATVQEQHMLEKWIAEDPEHRSFYNKLIKVWSKTSNVKMESSQLFNYERGLNRLRTKIAGKGETKVHQLSTPVRNSSAINAWKVAASVLFLVVSLSIFATVQFWESPSVSYATSGMEQRIINLPDGSTVRLNKNSKIEFPEGFSTESRKVTLQGEAFFEVEHDENRPFKIYLESGTVEVLGTSFIVKEMKSIGETMVAVKEGVVSLSSNSAKENKEAKLSTGQIGLLDEKNNKIEVEETSVQNYFGWMDGHLSFHEMNMGQVCSQLERMYELRCQLQDSSLNKLQLTVYTENLQLDDVLNTIAISLDIQYKRSGDKIVWSNK